jgi:hypothetical protein
MDPEHRVQVVLGEGEPNDGLLRFILEGEGFDIVGLASDDDELARVLRGARPEVMVLDGGISAPAALEARERAKGASLVVVWPDGVAAVIAEERVDPSSSIWELGDAVRRAAESAHVPQAVVRVPEAQAALGDEERRPERYAEVRIDPPPPAHARGRRGQLLVAAATWMLALTALASIAVAVPNALNLSSRNGGGRPSSVVPRDHSDDVSPDEGTATPRPTEAIERPPACDDPDTRKVRTDRAQGAVPAARGRVEGCPQRREKDDAGTKGGGRPDDPGSKGNGPGSKGETPSDDRGRPDGSNKPDREPPETGRSGDRGNGQGKSSTGHAARTDAGNTG